ncbi:MAG: homoserine kinase [Ardenticatenales bacterium]|nr:homoserine kinase [Ardenticatenales bacterium]
MNAARAFAPATIANLGPGFDMLGVAVQGLGDQVTATRRERAGVVIEAISGDGGRLPRDPQRNTAAIAAAETLRLLGVAQGVALRIDKGLPLGSGLGSSAASAAAAIHAVTLLFGAEAPKEALLPAGLAAEAAVSGWHADNVAPALLGGAVLVRRNAPLDIVRLPTPETLTFVLVTPDFELPTRDARAVLPARIPLGDHVANAANVGALVAALYGGDMALLGRALADSIVEPARAPLIPGFAQVQAAARAAGAWGCSISGAGPTLFAVADAARCAEVGTAMQRAFRDHGRVPSKVHIVAVDAVGARAV